MNCLLIALSRLASSIKLNKEMIDKCKWYQFRRKQQLIGAYEISTSIYKLLMDLSLDEMQHKKHTHE